jgi:beta-propeller repeat-containing protein
VTGETSSSDFPTTAGALQTTFAGVEDVFVTKVDPTGAALVYSTYLGGSGYDLGSGITVDALPKPNVYVTGLTGSRDFPTTSGALQTTLRGGVDAFVAKLADIALPPSPAVGKVSGGGAIEVTGGIGTFDFVVQRQADDGSIQGALQYVNDASGTTVRSVVFDSLAISGDMVTVGGTCTRNGASCTFTLRVTDSGEPGTNDSFTIAVDAGPPEGGTLRSGSIQIHRQSQRDGAAP